MRSIAILAALLFGTAAHAQIVALHVDFNADTIGSSPSTTPAGAPDGDSLIIYSPGGDHTVESAVGLMTDQPLLMTRTTTPATFGLAAVLDPNLQDCHQYVARWTSMVSQTVFFYNVSLRGPTGQLMASLEYRGGNALTYFSDPTGIAYAPNVPQDFEITVDMDAQTTTLSIDGVVVIVDRAFTSPSLKSVNFSPGGTDLYDFVVDDIEVIGTSCPSVSVEERSWGAIKASFR